MSLISKIWASLGTTGTVPDDEKIELGFVRTEKPEWQRFNWLFNRVDENINGAIDDSNGAVLKNMQYMSSNPTLTPVANSCTYFDAAGRFYMVHGVYVYYLDANKTWTLISTYFVDSSRHYSVQTHDHVVYAKGGVGLRCFTSSSFVPADVMPTGASTAEPLASKFEKGGSDNFIVVDSDVGILYSTTGVSGTWTAPTTSPATGTLGSLVWHGDDTFIAVNREGAGYTHIYRSVNDCDTFSQIMTGTSTSLFTQYMASNRDGILMAYIWDGTTSDKSIQKSDDDGVTWTESLTDPIVVSIYDIKHLTGKVWIATGEFLFENDTYGAAITKDDGDTWEHVELEQGAVTTNTGSMIGFSGNKIIYQEETTGKTIKSLAI